jgi:signal transduction histidine kinase
MPIDLRRLLLNRRVTMLLMLATLHLALTGGLSSFASRALLISHFGVFLLWQPVFRRDSKLSPAVIIAIAICGALLFLASSAWLIALWIIGLIGTIGGRVFTAQMRHLRLFYQFALGYLLMLLLFWVVPVLVAGYDVPANLELAVRYGLPLLLAIMLFLPLESDDVDPGRVVDFVYGLLFFLLVSVLALASLAFTKQAGNYYLALLSTTLGVGVALLILSVLWNPSGGYSGLQTFFSRYLLSLGLPFETWLKQLAEGAEAYDDPDEFLQFASEQLGRLPWVIGVAWKSPHGTGELGNTDGEEATFLSHDLNIKLFTRIRLSPAIVLHLRLLTQLLGAFYEAKQREQLLKQNAYIQAVHETGARLTHDIKNLLQSLFSLASAGENLQADQMDSYAKLIQRQLPALTKRLQLTLENLRAPQEQSVGMLIRASEWLDNLRARYEGRNIEFDSTGSGEVQIPRNLFDSVAENLLENARRKRINEPDIAIRLTLDIGEGVKLLVCDRGQAIKPDIVAKLFHQPVSSGHSTGIGLYQAHRQAKSAGFNLALESNRDGAVCFSLVNQN